MDDVQTLDDVLGKEVQLMVNIAPPSMDDKILVDEYMKILKSVRAAVDAISTMASSGVPNVSFTKYILDWQGRVAGTKYIEGKFARYMMKAVDFVCDRHVVLQGLLQLKGSGVNLSTGCTDTEQKARVFYRIVEMGR